MLYMGHGKEPFPATFMTQHYLNLFGTVIFCGLHIYYSFLGVVPLLVCGLIVPA